MQITPITTLTSKLGYSPNNNSQKKKEKIKNISPPVGKEGFFVFCFVVAWNIPRLIEGELVKVLGLDTSIFTNTYRTKFTATVSFD